MPRQALFDRAFFQALGTLSSRRQRDFVAFCTLRQFNSNASLVALLEAIFMRLEETNAHVTTVADLGRDCGMKPSTVEKSISQLFSRLHDFTLVHACLDHRDQMHQLPHEAWIKADLPPDQVDRDFRRRLKKLRQLPVTEATLHEELQLEHSRAQRLANQPRKDQGTLFDRHLDLLDQYYHLARLKYACAAINTARIFGQAQPSAYLRETHPAPSVELPPVAQAYQLILQMLLADQPQPDIVSQCLDFLVGEDAVFHREDRMDLFGYLLNTGVRGMATGNPRFDQLVEDIYGVMLEKGLLEQNGFLSGIHYKNLISVKVRNGHLVAAAELAEDYGGQLAPEEGQFLVPYCKGLVAFHSGELRRAIQAFAAVVEAAPEDLFYGLEARSMLWKAYFEAYESLDAEEHEEMLRLYDSFRVYVARNQQLSDYHRAGYQNFIRLFNRLIRLSEVTGPDEVGAELEALREEAKGMELVANKKWLLGAIEKKIAAGPGLFG